jgi:alcohol dehydrogenase class IV
VRHSWFVNAPMVIGRGSLEHLAHLGAKRVAVVGDKRALSAAAALERAAGFLRSVGADWTLIHDVTREPTTTDVESATGPLRAYAPDVILAMGGGSTLDLAKALWFFLEVPGAGWEGAFKPFAIPPLGRQARLIAIPTTSGTGSETTCAAVLVEGGGRKRLMVSRELTPSLAVLDPDLVDSAPASVASASGMDALTHALEAVVCTIATPMAAGAAVESAMTLLEWLEPSIAAPPGSSERGKARELVHYAATRAGMAINNSSAGLAHAMDQVGPLFGLSHGLACAIALPHTLEFIGPQCGYSRIARAIGEAGDDVELWKRLCGRIWRLCRELGIPTGYRECGIPEEKFARAVPELVREAVCSSSTELAPVVPDAAAFERMFWNAFRGEEPAAARLPSRPARAPRA